MNAQFIVSVPPAGYNIFLVITDDKKGYIVTDGKSQNQPGRLVGPCPCCMSQSNWDAIKVVVKGAIAGGVKRIFWAGYFDGHYSPESFELVKRKIRPIIHSTDECKTICDNDEAIKLVLRMTDDFIRCAR